MLKIVLLVRTDAGLVSQVYDCGHNDVAKARKKLAESDLGVGLVMTETGAVVARAENLLDHLVIALAAEAMPALEGGYADPADEDEEWDYGVPSADAE